MNRPWSQFQIFQVFSGKEMYIFHLFFQLFFGLGRYDNRFMSLLDFTQGFMKPRLPYLFKIVLDECHGHFVKIILRLYNYLFLIYILILCFHNIFFNRHFWGLIFINEWDYSFSFSLKYHLLWIISWFLCLITRYL